VNHRATPQFWRCYRNLPAEVQGLADRCYAMLRENPRHPSLHFKKIGSVWSVRIGLHYRALAVDDANTMVWFWIGSHSDYDTLMASNP
jgi:hypothetical protein